MKKIAKLISLILALVLFTVGCSMDSEENNSKKEVIQNDSPYINLTMIKPTTINPIFNTDKSVSYILDLVYDSLFEFDENYNLQPKLVDSYKFSSDNKTLDITLKDDVKWHNNEPLTSSDVKYTIDLIKSNQESPYYSLVSNIKSVKVNDSKSFTINFNSSYSFALETLIFPIISREQLSKLNSSNILLANNNLIGCGLYKIKEYEERDYMILEPNKDYYNKSDNKNQSEIYVKLVPDSESQVQLVLSLDSDISKVTLADISKFTDNEKFEIKKYQGRSYEYVLFNYDNEYLQNLNIRKAISASIDRQSIIKDAYSNRAELVNFPMNSTSDYYDGELKPTPYNTEVSKNYLKKAVLSIEQAQKRALEAERLKNELEKGLEEKTQDDNLVEGDNTQGVDVKVDEAGKTSEDDKSKADEADKTSEDDKSKADEVSKASKDDKSEEEARTFEDVTNAEVKELLKDMKFTIIVNKNNGERIKTASIISNNLEAIGIKSEIKDLTDAEMDEALNKKEYDLALIGCQLPATSDVTSVIDMLGYSDDNLSLYLDKLKNANSQSSVAEVYKDLQKYVKDYAIYISLGILDDYMVLNNRVEGDLLSNDLNIFRGISNLELK